MPYPRMEYVVFDMDGLLIDTERVYTKATNDILAPYGKEMTWDIKAGLMGKPERDAATHLLSFFPDISLTPETYLALRQEAQDALWPTVQPLPGALKLLKHLHAYKIPIAVATSSIRRNFELKTSHLTELFGLFEGRVVCSDDSEYRGKMKSKPSPDIFLTAARDKLGRSVGGNSENTECTEQEREERKKGLVFEDAILGVQAGKRAGMSVIWVPDPNLLDVPYSAGDDEKADQVITSLENFVPDNWGLPPY